MRATRCIQDFSSWSTRFQVRLWPDPTPITVQTVIERLRPELNAGKYRTDGIRYAIAASKTSVDTGRPYIHLYIVRHYGMPMETLLCALALLFPECFPSAHMTLMSDEGNIAYAKVEHIEFAELGEVPAPHE
jgi:hypothetical protein